LIKGAVCPAKTAPRSNTATHIPKDVSHSDGRGWLIDGIASMVSEIGTTPVRGLTANFEMDLPEPGDTRGK